MKELIRRMKPKLKRFYDKISNPPTPNILGAREIEYSFIFSNMPKGSGNALDLGVGNSYTSLVASRNGYKVMGIDLQNINFSYIHRNLSFNRIDLFNLNITPNSLDLIINCSTIEHIGLKGRYNVKKESIDGDLKAMELLKKLLRPKNIMILTIPVGKDEIFYPYHRVYGKNRLPKLLSDWKILKMEYWMKNSNNQWIITNKEEALKIKTNRHYHALGLFVLYN